MKIPLNVIHVLKYILILDFYSYSVTNYSTYPRNVAPFTGKALKAIAAKPLPNIRIPPSW